MGYIRNLNHNNTLLQNPSIEFFNYGCGQTCFMVVVKSAQDHSLGFSEILPADLLADVLPVSVVPIHGQ